MSNSSSFRSVLAIAIALFTLFNIFTVAVNAQYVIPNCGAYGVDLSPLNQHEIYGYFGTSTYVIRTCGRVTDSICTGDSTSNSSTVCQRGATNTSNAYALSFWNTSAVSYSRTRVGIKQQLITGEICGANGPRRTTVYYQCNTTATTPIITYFKELYTCQYIFTVQTNVTCSLPQDSTPCTFGGVDLSPMANSPILSFQSNFRYYVQMCSAITTIPSCVGSMVCQQRLDNSANFSLAVYEPDTIEWQVVPTGNNAGLFVTVPNGANCAAIGYNRSARIQLICDPTLSPTSSYIYGAAEPQTCAYQITIRTSLTCGVIHVDSSTGGVALSSSWWPATGQGRCTFNGVNFGDLYITPDLTWGGFIGNTYYDFFFHMCGVVRNRQCLSDSSTYNSMLCQTSATNALDNYALDYFVPEQWVWSNTSYGMEYVTTLGELCGTARRRVTVEFQCDNGLNRIYTVIADPLNTCNYRVIIKTNIVCSVAPLPPSSTGVQPQVPDCVYNGWDFKTLTEDGDLTYNVIGSTNYTIFLKMCSVVDQLSCRRDFTATQAMVCQARSDGADAYSIGDYNPVNQNWTEITANSTIKMEVGGGEMCGANPRRTIVSFICDQEYENRTGLSTAMISFGEGPTCVYSVTVIANTIICPYFNRSGGNLTVSSSSSSSSSSTGSFLESSISSSAIAMSSSAADDNSCLGGNNVPDGAVAFAMVFNGTAESLPTDFATMLMNALRNVTNSNQIRCGQVLSGGIFSNAITNTTSDQTIVTVYIVPGERDTNTIKNEIVTILNTQPSRITNELPPSIPPLDPTQFEDITCPNGQVPDIESKSCKERDDGSSGLSDGAIAGIVVGSVVGGLLLLAVICFLILRGRKSGYEGNSRNVEMTKA